jgi:hypothetical protein
MGFFEPNFAHDPEMFDRNSGSNSYLVIVISHPFMFLPSNRCNRVSKMKRKTICPFLSLCPIDKRHMGLAGDIRLITSWKQFAPTNSLKCTGR